MHIEVDQSGKIEQLNKDTYIAFSDGEQYCIKLSKRIKIIRVRAKPPFLYLRPGLDIYWSQHRPS